MVKKISTIICFVFCHMVLYGQTVSSQEYSDRYDFKFCNSSLQGLPTIDDSISNSTSLNALPVVAFGIAGLFVGGFIGHSIDPGPNISREFNPILSKAETTGILVGTAAGVTIGYILAKRDQRRKQESDNDERKLNKS